MNYVMHFCKNKQCNNGWVDEDLTGAKTYPPQWKYCKECSEKLGIDYNTQTTNSNLNENELKIKNERIKRLEKARQEKIKSTYLKEGV